MIVCREKNNNNNNNKTEKSVGCLCFLSVSLVSTKLTFKVY